MAYKHSPPGEISSVYQQDFVYHELSAEKSKPIKMYDPLSKLKTPPKPKQYDLSSLTELRESVFIPSSLNHRRKEPLQTNPHTEISETKIDDIFYENRLKARKTRPRIFMSPQILLDNLDENVMYKGEKPFANHIYSTNWTELSKFCEKHAFTHLKNENSKPITKKKLIRKDIFDKSLNKTRIQIENNIPNMDIELKAYAKVWDHKQPDHYIDTTEIFWKKNYKQLGLCTSTLCDPPPKNLLITNEEQVEIDKCTKTNTFSLPYTLMHSNYTGYQPQCPVGVPYTKKIFKKNDPYVTTSMVMQGIYEK